MDKILYFMLVIFFALLWLIYTRIFGAEYYPTSQLRVKKMLELARVGKRDIVYDLGSGDGRLVIAAARIAKKAIGIEIDFFRFLFSLIKIKFLRLKNVHIAWGNFFNFQLKDASVIMLFLRQGTNNKLREKLSKLKSGTRIISHNWTFDGWKIIKQDKRLKLYLYIIGRSNRSR